VETCRRRAGDEEEDGEEEEEEEEGVCYKLLDWQHRLPGRSAGGGAGGGAGSRGAVGYLDAHRGDAAV
jgi:hypothetical protein